MTPTTLLIEVGLPTVSLGVWFAAYGLARIVTRPTTVAAAVAAMDLPGEEPPAVVSLLVNGWQITVDAAESTLLDLAARGYLEFDQAGVDPRHTIVRLTNRRASDLNAYEHQVYQRVVERCSNGMVPLTALAFNDAKRAGAWSKRLAAAVVADARHRGLSRRRFSPAIVSALSVLAGVTALGVTVGAAHYIGRDDEDFGAVPGVFVVVTAVLIGIAGKVGGERDTPTGRARVAAWLGVRDWLSGHVAFAEQPPAAVAVWDRYLSYGSALGVTRVASRVIDLGIADRRRIWSSYGGGWRQVTVTYPRLLPRYGQRPGWILFRAGLAALLGWTFAEPRQLWQRLAEGDAVSLAFSLAGVALLSYAGYTLLRVVQDVALPAAVEGEVLWHQVWQTRREGGDDGRTVPVNYYLVIDDGRADRTRAWILPAEIADQCRVGDVVVVRVRPWTRRVLTVSVRQPGPGPGDVDPDPPRRPQLTAD